MMDVKRPAGVGMLLSRAFSLFGSQSGAMIAVACVMVVPTVVISGAMYAVAGDSWGIATSLFSAEDILSPGAVMPAVAYAALGLSYIITALVYLFLQPLAATGMALIAQRSASGGSESAGGALSGASKRYGRSIVLGLCNALIYVGVFIATYFASIVIMVPVVIITIASQGFSFMAFPPLLIASIGGIMLLFYAVFTAVGMVMPLSYTVAVNENGWGFKATGRAITLLGKRFWRMFGANLTLQSIWLFVSAAGIAGMFALPEASGGIQMALLALSCLAQVLIMSLTYTLACVFYYDVREKDEGWMRFAPETLEDIPVLEASETSEP